MIARNGESNDFGAQLQEAPHSGEFPPPDNDELVLTIMLDGGCMWLPNPFMRSSRSWDKSGASGHHIILNDSLHWVGREC